MELNDGNEYFLFENEEFVESDKEDELLLSRSSTSINHSKEEEYLLKSKTPKLSDQDLVYHGSLCKVLVIAAKSAGTNIFNKHHGYKIVETLAKSRISKIIRRLRAHNVINDNQWTLLYPRDKQTVTIEAFDWPLLYLLLRHVCSIAPPYPHGWDGKPPQEDESTAADLVRLNQLIYDVNELQYGVPKEEVQRILAELGEVSIRLLGAEAEKGIEADVDKGVDIDEAHTYRHKLNSWVLTGLELQIHENRMFTIRKRSEEANDLAQLTNLTFTDTQKRKGLHRTRSERSSRNNSQRSRHRHRISVSLSAGGREKIDLSDVMDFTKEDRELLQKHYNEICDVNTDWLLAKLVVSKCISHEEKNAVKVCNRNADRIKSLIDIMSKKSSKVILTLVEILKERYPNVYQILTDARQMYTQQDKPDEFQVLKDAIIQNYLSRFKGYSPIPWQPTVQIDLKEYYVPLYITDPFGRDVTPNSVFGPHPKCGYPKTALLEGKAGTGKSIFCHYLTYLWALDQLEVSSRVKLVIYLDLRIVSPDLWETIAEQCLSDNCPLSHAEMEEVLLKHQKDILWILDGVDQFDSPNVQLREIIYEDLFEMSSILYTVQTRTAHSDLSRRCDTRLSVLGVKTSRFEQFVRAYQRVSSCNITVFQPFMAQITGETVNPMRILAQHPLQFICMCFISELEGSLEFTTSAFLFKNFVLSLKKMASIKLHTEENVENAAEKVSEAVFSCEIIATENLKNKRTITPLEDLHALDMTKVFHLGILQRRLISTKPRSLQHCFFSSVYFEHGFVARRISQLDPADFGIYKERLVREKPFHPVAAIYAGLHRFNFNMRNLKELFNLLAIENKVSWCGRTFIMEDKSHTSKKPKAKAKARSITKVSNTDKEEKSPVVSIPDSMRNAEAKLSDFQTSLECLVEVEGRKDLSVIIQDSVPRKIAMRPRDLTTSNLALWGLSYLLSHHANCIYELDLKVDHVSAFTPQLFEFLGDALSTNNHVTSMTLRWSALDQLALLLSHTFGENSSVEKLNCLSEARGHNMVAMDSPLWNQVRSAGQATRSIKMFSFIGCIYAPVVTEFVRHFTQGVTELNLTGSSLDSNACQLIAERLETSSCMRLLNISTCSVKRVEFIAVMQGLKGNRSLSEILLSDTSMDSECFVALTEAIRQHTHLKKIDISKNTLSDDACEALGASLSVNRSVLEVCMLQCSFSVEGQRMLKKLKRGNVIMLGLDTGEPTRIKRKQTHR